MSVLAEPLSSFHTGPEVFSGVLVRLSGLVEQSIVDGPGLRMAVFTQGCPHRCAGCHNPETHSPDGGFSMDVATIISMFGEDPLLSGVTLSGGEPMLQARALLPLARAVRARGKSVWCYTGYRLEELTGMAGSSRAIKDLLGQIDVLVDGRYDSIQRSLALPYRGSANQRVLRLGEFPAFSGKELFVDGA